MPIPASFIVDVEPRVITGGSADLEMNGLVLSANDTISSATAVLEFTSPAAVAAYFGDASVEYALSQTYFAGYANKYAAPRSFFVARQITTAAAGWLRGARYNGTLATLQAITDGGFTIRIDGTEAAITGVDLSSAQSFSQIASLIQTAIDDVVAGVTVTYSSQFGAYTITSLTTGPDSMVEYAEAPAAGTDLSGILNLTDQLGAVMSPGSDALTPNEQMTKIRAATENWVTFTTVDEADGDEIMTWAAWASANYGYLYVPYTTDPNTASPDSSSDPASRLIAANYDHTAIVYGSVEYALFLMGAVASISWMRLNGTITLAFKRQAGLAAYVSDESTAAVLESKRCNYFGRFATRNSDFVFLYNGIMSSSDYTWIDSYINGVWLNNRLQVAIMDGISSTGRVPYNSRGYAQIRAWMMDPITSALNNGVIETGITLSESQKSELFNEAGTDITGELSVNGYYIQILDPGAAVRAQRETPNINVWYTYGGSVQRVFVSSTAIL